MLMKELKKQSAAGFVKGLPFSVGQLDGCKAAKRIMASNFDPRIINMPGTLSAVPHEDGMIVHFVSTGEDGKEYRWPVSQSQAASIFVNAKGEYEIPEV
jgi:hypothetical protein